MNKRQLHHFWIKFRLIQPRYFLMLAIASGVVCVFALRANNQHMVQLRNAVYQADKNDGNVAQSLESLQRYVYSHMNTALASGPNAVHPPIQLKYTYDRLIAADQKRVQTVNTRLYTDAQEYCQKRIPTYYGGPREACVNQYVTTHAAKTTTIPKNLYEFDFVSPKWSPDLAGWSMVVTALSLIFGVGFWASDGIIRRELG